MVGDSKTVARSKFEEKSAFFFSDLGVKRRTQVKENKEF